MDQKHTQVNLVSSFKRFLLEVGVVFILLAGGLFLESYSRGLVLIAGEVNVKILTVIFGRAIIATIFFVFIWGLAKTRLSFVYNYISASIFGTKHKVEENKKLSFFNDVFGVLVAVIITTPLRPIFQSTFLERDISDFVYVLVRYDGLYSVVILSVVALPLIILIQKYKEASEKYIQTILIIAAVVVVGVINYGPNFNARLYESRASWFQRDWQQQNVEAQDALADAQTDEEKAAAYFWLGVSENRRGNSEKAIEYQLKAIDLFSSYSAAHASLANAYIGNYYENDDQVSKIKSWEHAQKCIELEPGYAWCYQALANYYWVTNDVDNAIAAMDKTIELESENPEHYKMRDVFVEFKSGEGN